MYKELPKYKSFQNIFDEIVSDPNDKSCKLATSIVLTYECDPMYLYQFVGYKHVIGEKNPVLNPLEKLKGKCIVAMDGKRLQKQFSYPLNVDLISIKNSGFGCHHSKAYCFIVEDNNYKIKRIILVLGSFNLTHSGLFENRETLAVFKLSCEDNKFLPVFKDFSAILREYDVEKDNGFCDVADTIDRFIDSLKINEDLASCPRLLSSGYKRVTSGLDQLFNIVDQKGLIPKTLIVVSPFFDRREPYLIDQFKKKYRNTLSEFVVVSDNDGYQQIINKKTKFNQSALASFNICYQIDKNISDSERRFLSKHDPRLKDISASRSLHAKLIFLLDKNGQGIVYMGSANFTRKAWGIGTNNNKEIGFVQDLNMRISKVSIKPFLEGLFGAKITRICPEKLYDEIEIDNNDRDEIDEPQILSYISQATLIRSKKDDSFALIIFKMVKPVPSVLYPIKAQWCDRTFVINEPDQDCKELQCEEVILTDIKEMIATSRVIEIRSNIDNTSLILPLSIDSSIQSFYASEYYQTSDQLMDRILERGIPVEPNMCEADATILTDQTKEEIGFDICINRDDNYSVRTQNFISKLVKIESLIDKLLRCKNYPKVTEILSLLTESFIGESEKVNDVVKLEPVERIFRLAELYRIIHIVTEKHLKDTVLLKRREELDSQIHKLVGVSNIQMNYYLKACSVRKV